MKTTKANQRKGYQDSVGVEEFRGKYRLNLATKLTRVYYPEAKSNKRISTGLTVCPENEGKIEQTAWAIHYDILAGSFDSTLVKYGLVALEVVTPARQKELSVLEVYDRYVQSREGEVAETTLELILKGQYRRAILEANKAVDEDALKIKNYLVKNRCLEIAKKCLSYLEKAYQLGIKHEYVTKNPFLDMASEIKLNKGKKKTANNFDDESDESDARAFSVEEMNAIIEAFESSGYRQHLAPIIKFLFWTGCRTGEAIGFKWRDIKWDRGVIVFRRTYSQDLKIFKPTKTGVIRYFPMPKDGQLWNLLKSLPKKEPDDVVFSSKTGKIIDATRLARTWRGDPCTKSPGVIPELITQGKVSQYLKPYATRHTFISHQVNIHKIPITTVAQWVGNGAMVSNNSYLDRDKMTVPGYSDSSTQSSTSDTQKTPEQPTAEPDKLAIMQAEIEALKAQLAEYQRQH